MTKRECLVGHKGARNSVGWVGFLLGCNPAPIKATPLGRDLKMPPEGITVNLQKSLYLAGHKSRHPHCTNEKSRIVTSFSRSSPHFERLDF